MSVTEPNELVTRNPLSTTPIVPEGQVIGQTGLWLQFYEEAPRWEVWIVEEDAAARLEAGVSPEIPDDPRSGRAYVQAIASGDEPADLADDYLDWVANLDPSLQAEMANLAQLVLQMAEAQDV